MNDIVIPTIGRESLALLLESLARARGPRPTHIIVVDDRSAATEPLRLGNLDDDFRKRLDVVPGRAAGPASARNVGWRRSRATWVAFLDDDVFVDEDWLERLQADLLGLEPGVAGCTGRVRVPLPADREPTDWERNVAALATARWITADCAYRRVDLLASGGFDERFERAYREDADIALRMIARGKRIAAGSRTIVHPVRSAPADISVRLQAGNADDVLMDALHGPGWRSIAHAPVGAYPVHLMTVVSALLATAGAALWTALTIRFAWKRIAPGPRDAREVRTMLATSIAIPFVAVYHRLRGLARRRTLLGDGARAPQPRAAAVLFDRDGTLIADVPFNADPSRVIPMPGAREALERLRNAGILTAVVSNQSGVALGKLAAGDVDAINARTEALLGPLGPFFVCKHAPGAGCACRKPAPGLIEAAARELGVQPGDCVVIGDIGSDVEAAHAAGARAILVATPVTRNEEISAAPLVAATLGEAVSAVLSGAA